MCFVLITEKKSLQPFDIVCCRSIEICLHLHWNSWFV